MKPVAAAIDALKSEKNAFLGILLPVLHALSRRLVYFRDQASNQDLLVICYPLLEAVIEGIDKRLFKKKFHLYFLKFIVCLFHMLVGFIDFGFLVIILKIYACICMLLI